MIPTFEIVKSLYTMLQFIKYVFATIVGLFLFLFLISIVFGISIAGSLKKQTVKVKANSVLEASFNYPITERTNENPLDAILASYYVSDEMNANLGLEDIIQTLKKAKTDDKIKGMFLNLSGAPAGFATLEEIRDALIDFKSEDKFIVAYGETFSQRAYYLGSVADEIYLNPVGGMELKGFSAEIPFIKEALDRLEIEPQIFYVGDFKSATEPLRLTEMSPENREQTKAYLDDFYDIFLSRISTSRNISKDKLHKIVDSLMIREPKDAKQLEIVDDLYYIDQVHARLREKLGFEDDDKLNFVSLSKYKKAPGSKKVNFSSDKIAVVYAEGGIESSKKTNGTIGSEGFIKTLRKIRNDDKVKAVVLRVNSGGGSALASDVILQEVKLIKQAGKPVVVSMGDLAASGGYYIAAFADKIYAEENTITGSIGVFGMLGNFENFYKNKLGITFDGVKTTQYSDLPNSPILSRRLRAEEGAIIQQSIDQVYETFLQRVAQGRGLAKDSVHAIAQGRVWSGRQARDIGLVDEIGGIGDAIKTAASMAELEDDDYRVSGYPKKEAPLQKLLKSFSGEAKAKFLQRELGAEYKIYKKIKDFQTMDPIQMRLPFDIEIH